MTAVVRNAGIFNWHWIANVLLLGFRRSSLVSLWLLCKLEMEDSIKRKKENKVKWLLWKLWALGWRHIYSVLMIATGALYNFAKRKRKYSNVCRPKEANQDEENCTKKKESVVFQIGMVKDEQAVILDQFEHGCSWSDSHGQINIGPNMTCSSESVHSFSCKTSRIE